MQGILRPRSKKILLLCTNVVIFSVNAGETPETYEELMGLVLNEQSTAHVQLLDRALQTPSNEFEQKYLMGFGRLASPQESQALRLSTYPSMPSKDLRQEAATKLLLSGIVKPEELFRAYETHGKRVSENPREIASLSSPLLSFFYYQAYKKYEPKKTRDLELEKAIMTRFKEQSAKAKAEMLDPERTQVLSNCDDPQSDLSVSLVGLSSIPADEKSTLDVVTHHFIFPQVGIAKKIWNQLDPHKECEAKAAELKKSLETARQENQLLLLKANAAHFELEPFQRFNTGEFIKSCRESFGRLWSRYKKVIESSMPLSEAHDQRVKSDLEAELTFCRNSTSEDLRRVTQQRSEVGEQRRQRIIQADQLAHDNNSWGKAYTAVMKDPSLIPIAYPDVDPAMPLRYQNNYPRSDESPEEKQERLRQESEIAILAESVRAERRAKEEAEEKLKLAAEEKYLKIKAQWDKEWNNGYGAIISGQTLKSFEESMKDLSQRRANAEKAFFADKENEELLLAKYRIEARAKTFATTPTSSALYSSSPRREITPEYIADLVLRREAESRALQVRLKAHGDYIDSKSSIAIPSDLTDNQKYAYVMRYLDKLELETFEKEYEALKKAKQQN